ncbi:MAG: ATP synthase A1 subunit C [Thermoplasmata archaeon]|nr:ATP synthase A1 subunit C [Thermoplasmata archaeon]
MNEVIENIKKYTRRLVRKVPLDLGNYPYVCARVKAKNALLYPPEMYQKFLQMKIPQINRTLGEGEYREELLALGARFSGVNLIEMATRDNLAKVYTQILDFSEGPLKNVVSRFIDRWDVFNIQTVLRGKFYGADRREVLEDIIPAGTFTLEFLRELVEKESIEEVIEALKDSVYYDPLVKAKEKHEKVGTVSAFEDALSRRYYDVLLDTLHPTNVPNRLFLKFIRMEIDVLNLRVLLRLNLGKAEVEESQFVDGGLEMGVDELNEMLKMDWESLVSRLRKFSFYETIAPGLKRVKEKGLNEVMRSLEKYVLREATRHAHLHPLSILPVLDFMVAKRNEVENIRIIARGKAHGLDNDVIRDLLVTR